MQSIEIKETMSLLNKQFELVRGEFSPEDAQDILNHLITKKINFHKLKNFSHEIRYGKPDENSLKRINELKTAKAELIAWIDCAKMEEKNLQVNSSVSIELL
ncbi:hypothetical protein [Roseivirga seohaensis]|nr:hypothetical protein [Roseivirga seohaensis]